MKKMRNKKLTEKSYREAYLLSFVQIKERLVKNEKERILMRLSFKLLYIMTSKSSGHERFISLLRK